MSMRMEERYRRQRVEELGQQDEEQAKAIREWLEKYHRRQEDEARRREERAQRSREKARRREQLAQHTGQRRQRERRRREERDLSSPWYGFFLCFRHLSVAGD
jgi:hypothetical protein